MRHSATHLVSLIAVLLLFATTAHGQVSRENPKGAVTSFFNQLKNGQYDALYEQLPSQIQKTAPREQTVRSLKRLGSFIAIERMDIGRVQQRASLAVVDTTIYGRLTRPMKLQGEEIAEGRVVVQQYLIKEGKEWRVITADDRTRAFFMRENPDFANGFSLTQPQFSYKRNGAWQNLVQPAPGSPAGRPGSPSN